MNLSCFSFAADEIFSSTLNLIIFEGLSFEAEDELKLFFSSVSKWGEVSSNFCSFPRFLELGDATGVQMSKEVLLFLLFLVLEV